MKSTRDTWTTAHDLALVYISLAYGTDCELSDEELAELNERLGGWEDELGENVEEVIVRAMSTYLDEDTEHEVARAISSLAETLSVSERRRALRDVIRIAEADGVVLSAEQNLIATLASVWGVKDTEERLMDQSHVEIEDLPSWSVFHDLALIYLVVAHSTDDELSNAEIEVMLAKLGEWQPDLTPDEIREVLRFALNFYSEGVDENVLRESIEGIRNSLSVIQRLVVLDDLNQIAHADGVIDTEREMIHQLANAWGVAVKLNGEKRQDGR